MNDLFEKLELIIACAEFRELDKIWNYPAGKIRRIGHWNNLYFITEGFGTVKQEDRVFILEPGVMLLIPPEANVSLNCPERLVKYWCRFNARLFDSHLDMFSLDHDCAKITPKKTDEILSLFTRLVQAVENKCPELTGAKKFEAKSVLALLLSDFIEIAARRMAENGRRPQSILKIAQIISHIENNISHQFSLHELADIAGLNPNYASNLFKAVLGESLGSYCTRLRVKRAASIFQNSNISVAEVAGIVGVRDLSNFSKMFKARTGLSPMCYKKAYMEGKIDLSILL
jgi:AraC-like DNA-binding protein